MTDQAGESGVLLDGVVRAERRGHVLLITLNRPEARNAVNYELAAALGAAVELLNENDDLRVGVITGAGKAFCAGQDLKALGAGEGLIPPEHAEWGFAGFVRHFSAKPIIAAVHGFALGGGLEIALACDLVVAEEGARLGLPEVTRGLFAAGGGVPRIAQQIPQKVALRMLLTGQPVSAEVAERWGLVNEVAPVGTHVDVALALAEVMAANAPLAVQATKRLVYEGANQSAWRDEPWVDIDQTVAEIFASADAVEGAQAFVEKRPPVWQAR
ncbi:crotonase/enoyl-CoA hydratase family protein [Subtercola endophyticus]|uniref:crotonase/enoyl-CoA hydratase family protein n=1 Tax=Subtercola endophyticus TaxID=2895559 RepID=UPI001E2F5237|nr:crotonase/enoyl-CoA hydratase family protein [Subtercola endophyticus]UFS58318.1 crotonase/enoyl-CoA hydratase family protein [Subtercola endophyticus]